MADAIAWLNGRYLPYAEARLPVDDLGFVQGAAVTEMVRTFRHRLFRLEEHLDRLFRSLALAGFGQDLSRDTLRDIAHSVIEYNSGLIAAEADLGLTVFVTPGLAATYSLAAAADRTTGPTVCVHSFPLPFHLWAERCRHGQHLVVPPLRQIPTSSLDPRIKHRSRMHWYLADRQAREVHPHASALLLDEAGRITETSTANFAAVIGDTIVAPPADTVLPGVSLAVVRELAVKLGLMYREADLRLGDVFGASEAFTSSTPYCLMPVVRIDSRPIGAGVPGPVFQRLMTAWNDLAGLDIIAQMCSRPAAHA